MSRSVKFVQRADAPSGGDIPGILARWEKVRAECFNRVFPSMPVFASAANIELDGKFAVGILNAVTGCVIQHREGYLKRMSEHRKELLEIYKHAAGVADAMQKLSSALYQLTPDIRLVLGEKWGSEGLEQMRELALDALRFCGLAGLAKDFSVILEDKGGPTKFAAFGALVRGLADAFEHGRGRRAGITRKVDTSEDDVIDTSLYEGDFMRLVEKVLPVAIGLAEAGDAPRLAIPESKDRTARALGKYLERVTNVRRAKRK